MKVVIIGGGIAGLTLGVFLKKHNFDVVVNEKCPEKQLQGHAFLMHADGLKVLNNLNSDKKFALKGKSVTSYTLQRPDGEEVKHHQLAHWYCIKRVSLVSFLNSLMPVESVKQGRDFSHFLYEDGKAVAAVFHNGEVETGDLFIGADGGYSRVRQTIYPDINFTPVKVKEVVSVSHNPAIAQKYAGSFKKFQSRQKGLGFGFIPTSDEEIVWFLQYDTSINDISEVKPEIIKDFCKEIMEEFPEVVQEILDAHDFNNSYIWNTRDFDLLPAFHNNNVALIGDAAHLALPFTSAGTTNAIIDAQTLAEQLIKSKTVKEAFEHYYAARSADVRKHVTLGRDLQVAFLNPSQQSDDNLSVPLIPAKKTANKEDGVKRINVLYFTDPICSTCWIIQPLLRRLKLEYGHHFNIEYKMGGLLPSWDCYTSSRINNPKDAAEHWEEASQCHQMPLDGDIWIEDPVPSSYPPSIAFKAAQLQDPELAIQFLRRMQEMLFLEKKNIIKWEHLKEAAFDSGLDVARLKRDFEGKAKTLFEDDLFLANQLGVKSFPTLFFSDENNRIMIKGYQGYEKFEEIIHQLIPAVSKTEINTNPEHLFTHFPTMADKEFAFLSNIPIDNASKILQDLFANGNLDKYESKNGVIWKSKFAFLDY